MTDTLEHAVFKTLVAQARASVDDSVIHGRLAIEVLDGLTQLWRSDADPWVLAEKDLTWVIQDLELIRDRLHRAEKR